MYEEFALQAKHTCKRFLKKNAELYDGKKSGNLLKRVIFFYTQLSIFCSSNDQSVFSNVALVHACVMVENGTKHCLYITTCIFVHIVGWIKVIMTKIHQIHCSKYLKEHLIVFHR